MHVPINTSSVPEPLSSTIFSCRNELPTLFMSLSAAVTDKVRTTLTHITITVTQM